MRRGGGITRGASTVEYALILVAVILLAAGSFKLLGGKVGTRSGSAGDVVAGEGNGKSGASIGGGGGGSGGGKTVSGQANVGTKVSVGGGGGGGGSEQGGPGSTRDTSTDSNAVASVSNKDSGGNADVAENFTAKRWMGIGLLFFGVVAIGYVVATMRRTKKAADAAGPGKEPPAGGRRRSRKK